MLPRYVKYNDNLRGFGAALQGCKGNRYVTSIHVINSCIVKTSKLTKVSTVYRGVAGGVLPDRLCEANILGFRGGVDKGFLSTTYKRDVAMNNFAAGSSTSPSILFEIEMGMVYRGSELDWISQYEGEAECLFPPLTGLQLMGTDAEGTTLVVKARLSTNLKALTIEQVTSKMKNAHLDFVNLIADGFTNNGVPERALQPMLEQRDSSSARVDSWFHSLDHFLEATDEVFVARKKVFTEMRRAETWKGVIRMEQAVRAAEWCSREGEHETAIDVLRHAGLSPATWMAKDKELVPPWPATFATLKEAPQELARLVEPLARRDELAIGMKVLAHHPSGDGFWDFAKVQRVGGAIDVKADGWSEEMGRGLPRVKALAVKLGGAGALLRVASADGRMGLVEALLEKGVSPLVVEDRMANTALHLAAAGGHANVCDLLRRKGADSTVQNARFQAAADVARVHKHWKVVRYFVPTLSDLEFTDAACNATPRLRAAAESDAATLQRTRDNGGAITALMVACRHNQTAAIEILLASSNVNAQSCRGCTALYLAAEDGNARAVRALLRCSADANITASNGGTCLQRASEYGHDQCARALLEAGSDPNKANNKGVNALMLAAISGHEQCARALLEAGAQRYAKTKMGDTALSLAERNGHAAICKLLE